MTLDLNRPKGKRRLVPGANIKGKPEPLYPHVVYYMDGIPNIFEVWGTVTKLLKTHESDEASRDYRDNAMKFDRYEEVIEFTEQYIRVVRVASGGIE